MSVVNWQPTGGLMVQAKEVINIILIYYVFGSSRSAWSKGRRPPGAVLH